MRLATVPKRPSYVLVSDWLRALVVVVGNCPAVQLEPAAYTLVEVRLANTGSSLGAAASLEDPLQLRVVAPVLLP